MKKLLINQPKTIMSRKIAIVNSQYVPFTEYNDIESNTNRIISSISEWQEVSEEDYQMLIKGQAIFNYQVFEQPTDQRKFIADTVEKCKQLCQQETERKEAEAKMRQELLLKRQQKKEEKAKANKLRLFKKLQAELGTNQPIPDIPKSEPPTA